MSTQVKQVSVEFDAVRATPGKMAGVVEALLLGAAKAKAEKIEIKESREAQDEGWHVERIQTVHEHGVEPIDAEEDVNAEHLASVETTVTLTLKKSSGGGGGAGRKEDEKTAQADKKKAAQKKKAEEDKKQEDAEAEQEESAETSESEEFVEIVEYEYIEEMTEEDAEESISLEEAVDIPVEIPSLAKESLVALEAQPEMEEIFAAPPSETLMHADETMEIAPLLAQAAQNFDAILTPVQKTEILEEMAVQAEKALEEEEELLFETFSFPSFTASSLVAAQAFVANAEMALTPAQQAVSYEVEPSLQNVEFPGIVEGSSFHAAQDSSASVGDSKADLVALPLSTPQTQALAQNAVMQLAQGDRMQPSELTQSGLNYIAQSDQLLTLDQFQQNFETIEPVSLLPDFQNNMAMAALPGLSAEALAQAEAAPSFALNEASYTGNPFHIPLSMPSLPAAPAPSMN